MSSSTDIDVGNPRRPFSERSAKMLYRALKDVEEAMNDEELKTARMCQQIPLQAMEARKGAGAVKDLMVRTEVDLKTVEMWLVARNEMVTVSDPDGVDMSDHDIAAEMIAESSRVIDQVTELAEKWQELALKPFEVDMQIALWSIEVTKVKTELRLMLSMFKAAKSIRRGEKYHLQ